MRAALQADALAVAAAEVTAVFVGLGLIAGILWGRPAWGIWWAWDARTTSTLLLWLLYVSYLLVRRFSSEESSKTLAAVLSVFAGVNVPIVFMSIRWWRTQHPAPVLTGDGYIDPAMKAVFGWNLLAYFVWGTTLVWARYAVLRREQQVEARSLEHLLTEVAWVDYSAESVKYLHIAYALMFLGQLAYVLWLAVRWNKVKRESADRDA